MRYWWLLASVLLLIGVSLGGTGSYSSGISINVSVYPGNFTNNSQFTGVLANINASYTQTLNGVTTGCQSSLILELNNSKYAFNTSLTPQDALGINWKGNITIDQTFLNQTRFGVYNGTIYCGSSAYSLNGTLLYINDTEAPDYVGGGNNSVVNNATNVSFNFWDPSNVTSLAFNTNASAYKNWTTGINSTNATLVLQFPVNTSQKVQVNVTVNDSWSNSETYSFLVTVDLDPPNISNVNIAPTPGNSSFGPWVGPTFNISVNVSDISNTTCWAEMNTTRVSQNVNGTGQLTIPVNASLPTGNYTLTVKCVDSVGNANNTSRNVSLDNTKPSMSWNSPNYWITNKTWVYVNVTAGDSESGLNTCQMNWTKGTVSNTATLANSSGYWVYNVSLAEGNWTLTVKCEDNVGNPNQISKTITLDLTPPNLAYNWSSTNSTITVSVNASDPYLNYTLVSIGSQNCTNNASSFSCTFTGLSDNTNYTVIITSYDKAGNVNSTNFTAKTRANPIASFTASTTSGNVPLTVTFNASQSYDPDGTIVSYYWDFGDGTNASGEVVNHTYTSAGTYTVVLTVTDNDGYTDGATVVIAASTKPSGGGFIGGGASFSSSYAIEDTKPKEEENELSGSWIINNLKIEWYYNYDESVDKTTVKFIVHGSGAGKKYEVKENVPAEFGRSLGSIAIYPKWDKMYSWSPASVSWYVSLGEGHTFTIINEREGKIDSSVIENWNMTITPLPPTTQTQEGPVQEALPNTNQETKQVTPQKTTITGLVTLPSTNTPIAITLVLVVAGLLAAYLRVRELKTLEEKYPLKYKE